MEQMYNKYLNNVNIYNAAGVGQPQKDVGAASAASPSPQQYSIGGNVDELLGYSYMKGKAASNAAATVDGFKEYMKARQEKLKENELDDAAREREEKENEREIARNLSHEEIKQLRRLGIDVEGVSLSDLSNMLNTLRGRAKRERTAELMEKVIKQPIKQPEPPKASDGVGAGDSGEKQLVITENELGYLLKNGLSFNSDNLYKAHFSGFKLEKNMEQELKEQLMPQLTRVVEQAGFLADAEALGKAEELFASGIPVTTDNVRRFMEYSELVGMDIMEADMAYEPRTLEEAADRVYDMTIDLDSAAVYEMSMKKLDVTLAAVRGYGENRGEYVPNEAYVHYTDEELAVLENITEAERNAIVNMRRVEELRLSMTYEASYRLVKSDINIDTRELSQVVARLRELEQQLLQPLEADERSLYKESAEKLAAVSKAPVGIIAAPFFGRSFSVDGLYTFAQERITQQTDTDFFVQREDSAFYEQVRRSYAAAETAPRQDMGDSIQKAFGNISEVLERLGIADDYETERAVKILAYNRIDVTGENIYRIMDYDRQVNQLFDRLYPEAVVGLIKDGINPMDMDISELNVILQDKNYNEGVTQADNFAQYLRDIERQGEITDEERESYVGLYRLMDKLNKSGDREAGYLFANGSRLTVRNLISAMRSRRARGIDVNIDDDFGMLDELHVEGKRIDEQIESAWSAEYNEASKDESTLLFMEEHDIKQSVINIEAAHVMVNNPSGIYGMMYEVLAKLGYVRSAADEMVDEETENITDSLLGEDIPVELEPEGLMEAFTDSDSMADKYQQLQRVMLDLMYSAGEAGRIGSEDAGRIKLISAGFNIMRSMARDEHYTLPYRTESGISVINLTVVRGEEKQGSILIDFDARAGYHVRAELYPMALQDGRTALAGMIYSDTQEGNYSLMGQEEYISELLPELDLSKVTFGRQAASADKTEYTEKISTGEIYSAAVKIARVLTEKI